MRGFGVLGLLRGDFNSRVTAYNSAITTGWLNIDAVRTLEDLPPVPDGLGQAYRVPLANVNLAAAYLVEEQEKVKMVKAKRKPRTLTRARKRKSKYQRGT